MSDVEVILCFSCKGTGVTKHDELTDYHKREYNAHVADCKRCNGTGRLKKITKVTYEAYTKPTLGTY